jgi:hypothetical protein
MTKDTRRHNIWAVSRLVNKMNGCSFSAGRGTGSVHQRGVLRIAHAARSCPWLCPLCDPLRRRVLLCRSAIGFTQRREDK